MLDLHRGRILREVARLGSMTAAARSLAYTQPAVSHHIARLEAEAGTPLVVRHGRGVRLTEAGRILVEHVEDVLARMADAEERIAAVAGLRAGRVRVAVFPTAAGGLLPDALARLRARAPGVSVRLADAEPGEALAALRAGETDVAVVFRYPYMPPDTGSRFREIVLGEDPIRLLVPAGHPVADAPRPRLADLAGETWASGCARCRDHLRWVCERAGFAPDIAFATEDHVAIQRLVARGLAVTTLPGLALGLHAEPGVARPAVPMAGRRRIAALVPAGPRPPAVAALLEELAAVAAARLPADAPGGNGTGEEGAGGALGQVAVQVGEAPGGGHDGLGQGGQPVVAEPDRGAL
ncbi:LysR family transcriptional regulator [Actinomadura livida]|uniref:DNA-binding transcriptional LysR family regulator n=1 Tax=Actinomadura livida TaxID=79909 RepID=A0A7W7IEP5_9ACTN|nr:MULTISPECIES: LysR family transcriptional regulator [Actinomadura]MBB4775353.1 DNA-binding transcriptional LysR family regulator [Actinomadura catellatispora]GGT89757.1 LysR family transcriptional regulator [Actinomadura livida]